MQIRTATPADVEAIVTLGLRVYSAEGAYTPAQIASQIAVFPQGQFVAVDEDGEIVAMAGSLLVSDRTIEPLADWNTVTSGGTLATHDACGDVLYGFETMVAPAWRRLGIGRALFWRRVDLAARLGARAFRGATRLSGYAAWHGILSAAEYLDNVLRGECIDPALTWSLSNGFTVCGLVPHYLDRDPESLGWAAIVDFQVVARALTATSMER
jgi:predicted N-acetyltransferase YhbS